MPFLAPAIDPRLPKGEYERLIKLLAVHYAFPLTYPLAGGFFESLFASAVNGKKEERKLLFDVLRGATGWSLKTLLWSRLEEGDSFELVLQRCDILKDPGLTLASPLRSLGAAILKHFNSFCVASAKTQEVTDPRAGFLIRRRERDFVFFQQRYRLYENSEVSWQWANDGRRSILGFVQDELVLRWYRSGTQLFGVYRIPRNAHRFELEWRPANLDDTVDFFVDAGVTKVRTIR